MEVKLPSGTTHLTYCTNIHRGETWEETFAALQHYTPAVKRMVSPDAPMGVGLRLSAVAAEVLERSDRMFCFKEFLAQENLYVFTINGFPYGPFHGTPVKTQVYAPDWREPERLAYTNRLARLMASLLPDNLPNLVGSISTVPGAFRSASDDAGAREIIAEALLRQAAYLRHLEERTGRRIAIALEPEPMCLFETTAEIVEFFQDYLLCSTAAARFAELSGCTTAASGDLLRQHLGVCLDVCHAAVEFEPFGESISLLRKAGIAINKLQLSSALAVRHMDQGALNQLRQFDDGIYLHQVVERGIDGRLTRFLDLPHAFAESASGRADGCEWRIHCHVPVFHDAPIGRLGTTQADLIAMLALQREQGFSPHLEVETYTWDVLPPELKTIGIEAAIAREILWVRNQLLP